MDAVEDLVLSINTDNWRISFTVDGTLEAQGRNCEDCGSISTSPSADIRLSSVSFSWLADLVLGDSAEEVGEGNPGLRDR